jgi:hypothetical protein
MGADLTVADRILAALAKNQEHMFEIEVSDQDFRKFTTVSKVIRYVEGGLKQSKTNLSFPSSRN